MNKEERKRQSPLLSKRQSACALGTLQLGRSLGRLEALTPRQTRWQVRDWQLARPRVRVRACLCLRVFMLVRVCVCPLLGVYVFIFVCVYLVYVRCFVCLYICGCWSVFVLCWMYVFIFVCVYIVYVRCFVCMYICVCVVYVCTRVCSVYVYRPHRRRSLI